MTAVESRLPNRSVDSPGRDVAYRSICLRIVTVIGCKGIIATVLSYKEFLS